MAKLSKLQQGALNSLPALVEATNAGSYIFADPFNIAYLIENGLALQNHEIVNPENEEEFATRATDAGIAAVTVQAEVTNEVTNKVEEPKPERKVKMSFEIEKGIPVPKTTRGGARTGAYPFETLELNDSFFIPASEKHPEPAKSLASTVSGATKRFDVADLDENGIQKTKSTRNPKTGEVKENVPALKHTRTFIIRAGEKVTTNEAGESVTIKGARVFRTL